MMINNLPKKFTNLWRKALPLLRQDRPGDDIHVKEVVENILKYQKSLKLDLDILIPVAILHDIGHSQILPEHFKYITGFNKVANGKLVHMLVGAKIAQDLLKSLKYDAKKTKEIVDIISMHDIDQLTGLETRKLYNTRNKKIFHDIDSLDQFNEKRIKRSMTKANLKQGEKIIKVFEGRFALFFYDSFRKIAESNFQPVKDLFK